MENVYYYRQKDRKINRSHKKQVQILWQYMQEHPDFAAANFKTSISIRGYERQWLELKAILDKAGAVRSVKQWKICWRDQKRKARAEIEAANARANGEVPAQSEPEDGADESGGPAVSYNKDSKVASNSQTATTSYIDDPLSETMDTNTPKLQEPKKVLIKRKARIVEQIPNSLLAAQVESNKILKSISLTLLKIQQEMAETNRLQRLAVGEISSQHGMSPPNGYAINRITMKVEQENHNDEDSD